ncbi:MAG: DUF3426 domain-containing protein [Lysobacteraceae bacterium]
MFILCPHCQFLVAIDPATGLPPAHCPRCGKALAQAGAGARAGSEPAAEDAATGAAADAARDAPASPTPAAGSAGAVQAGAHTDARVPKDVPPAAAAEAAPVQRRRAAHNGGHAATQTPAAHTDGPVSTAANAPTAPVAAEATTAPAARPARRKTKEPQQATAATQAAPPTMPEDGATPVADAHAAPTVAQPPVPRAPPPEAAHSDAPGVDTADGRDTVRTEVTEDPAATQAGPDAHAVLAIAPSGSTRDAVPASGAPRRAPSFARGARPSAPRPRWRPIAATAALALLLVLQVLLADRAALAADARWRPLVASLCKVLRCTVPAWREPAAFTLLARDVRPLRPGVLHVSARFRNDARWPQAWPRLHLALQDVDGRTVGARTLAPAEYLGAAPITQNGIGTGQVASVAFDIAEPSATVVAFTFDFR